MVFPPIVQHPSFNTYRPPSIVHRSTFTASLSACLLLLSLQPALCKQATSINLMQHTGKFVISLDFELMWGVRDLVTINSYGDHLRGVHTAIPRMLQSFDKYKVQATFATVGFLFFSTKEQMLLHLPAKKPGYTNKDLSPYNGHFSQVGQSLETDLYHFGSHLVRQIKDTPGQEIATHTFSHYYCLEDGQTVDDFRDDLAAAIAVAQQSGISIKSIVFPRNQYNAHYLQVCKENGITSIRGNEASWLYEPRPFNKETMLRRALRLVDAYINITGHHCYTNEFMGASRPFNIPASRFLRQYKPKLKMLEGLRLRRIKKSMTHAAKNGLTYHLWWHPHNFGINQNKNIIFLEKILQHYQQLNQQYNFTSSTMAALATQLEEEYGG
jgi:peptidoglycan/xylan/chitin deacetylase (PgdA/CDA1 family)